MGSGLARAPVALAHPRALTHRHGGPAFQISSGGHDTGTCRRRLRSYPLSCAVPSSAAIFCRHLVSLILGATLLLAGGCHQYHAHTGSVAPSGARPATALVIVIQNECTEAEYLSWRGQIVSYLIERGYIVSEDELIADPAGAQRVIRAIVGPGGFTLSVFHAAAEASPPPNLEITDILYPADPYFVLGFYYFGEIGPRHLPPRPPGYRPHPRPPDRSPPRYPRYDHDRHWPRFPRSDDRGHPGHWPRPPDTRDNPPSDHRPAGPDRPPPSHPPRPAPSGRREHPRDPTPPSGPAQTPPPPSHVTPPPPGKPPPSSAPAKPEKPERKDEEKHPHRPEHER